MRQKRENCKRERLEEAETGGLLKGKAKGGGDERITKRKANGGREERIT